MNFRKYMDEFSDEMKFKNYADKTIEAYQRTLWKFLKHFETKYKEPKGIPEREIKEYLKTSISLSQLKHRIGSLKFFYVMVIRQPLKFKYIEYPRKERKLPIVLDTSEIQAMFNVCRNLKHKAIMSLLYSTGMRISELINLKICDIDSKRMVIIIQHGKGNKDRQVPLDNKCLELLRNYAGVYKPKEYLFNGQFSLKYSSRSVEQFLKKYASDSKIKKRVYPHLFRHTSFTHLLEQGTDISLIQKIAGHRSPKTTQMYTHISTRLISSVKTPFNSIAI